MRLTFNTSKRSKAASRTLSVTILVIMSLLAISVYGGSKRKGIQVNPGRNVRIEGELEIVYEDAHPTGRLLYFLNAQGKKLAMRFANHAPANLHTGMRVTVTGVQVGETLELNSGGDITQSSSPAALATSPLGQHRVLVIMVNFQDKQTQPFTREQAQAVMFGTTSDFFREASYGQTWLTGDVFGWYTIPVSYTSCDTTAISTYAQQAAASAGANIAGYDHLVYAFPQNACTWQGRGSVGGTPSQAWINEWFELGIVGHELGHNFGLYHSRSMDCGAFAIGGSCTTDEYGDTLDLMGAANSAHFNLFQKERLGWANSGTTPPITTVTSSGTYWLDSYESANLNPKGLKILKSTDPTTGMKSWYYIEHRVAYGFDSFLSDNNNVLNGVVIRTGSEASGQQTYLLDMTPATSSWYDPALSLGQTFSDSDAGITITTLSADATGALVTITMATQPCVRSNPTVSITPGDSGWLPSGASISFDVLIRNNDGAGCSDAAFNLQSSSPSGWSAVFGSPSVVVNPGSTTNATFQVTSPLGTADGFYPISVAATNALNSNYSSSATATYSLVSSLSVAAACSQTTYTRNQTLTVNTTVRAAGVALPGALVTFTMTKSNGTIVTSTATTGANGVAVFKYSFNRKKDPTGTYQVRAQASKNSVTGSSTVTYVVK